MSMSSEFCHWNGVCDPLFISFLLPLSFLSRCGTGYRCDNRAGKWGCGSCKETRPRRRNFAREAVYWTWPALSIIRLLTLMGSPWSSEHLGIVSFRLPFLSYMLGSGVAENCSSWEVFHGNTPSWDHKAYRSGLSATTPFSCFTLSLPAAPLPSPWP